MVIMLTTFVSVYSLCVCHIWISACICVSIWRPTVIPLCLLMLHNLIKPWALLAPCLCFLHAGITSSSHICLAFPWTLVIHTPGLLLCTWCFIPWAVPSAFSKLGFKPPRVTFVIRKVKYELVVYTHSLTFPISNFTKYSTLIPM